MRQTKILALGTLFPSTLARFYVVDSGRWIPTSASCRGDDFPAAGWAYEGGGKARVVSNPLGKAGFGQ